MSEPGITASAYSWPGVAAALPEDWRLVAPDLRGRGMLGEPPGLLAAEAVQAYDEELDHLTTESVPGVNHCTIASEPAATRRLAEVITG